MTVAGGRPEAPETESNQIMTVEQVAEYLQLNRLTVYRYVREGRIPAAKIGKLYRILKADVDAFLEGQKTRLAVRPRPSPDPAAVDRTPPSDRKPMPIQHPPEDIYVGPSWRERRRVHEEGATRRPTYPIEWVIRGLHYTNRESFAHQTDEPDSS